MRKVTRGGSENFVFRKIFKSIMFLLVTEVLPLARLSNYNAVTARKALLLSYCYCTMLALSCCMTPFPVKKKSFEKTNNF